MDNYANRRIVILSGGFSDERSVSVDSSAAIELALRQRNYETFLLDPIDFPQPGAYQALLARIRDIAPLTVFLGLHGGSGENGQVQALLELEGIPFTGSGSSASALCMDKYRSTLLTASAGFPVPRSAVIRKGECWLAEAPGESVSLQKTLEILGSPVVVKPNDSGSSVGVRIVSDDAELGDAIHQASGLSAEVLMQQFIPGRELTVAILDETPLPPVEIRPHEGFYDFANKYQAGRTEYLAPAPLDEPEITLLKDYGRRIFLLHGCRGYGRVDFRYDGERFYFLEVNTLPGMTALSLTPKAAAITGINFETLIERIIQLAINNQQPPL
jgi:D-alanine-D-alanine ligase